MLALINKKKIPVCAVIGVLVIVSLLLLGFYLSNKKRIIKIGILHSLTGSMAVSESSLINAYNLAIHEVNTNHEIPGAKLVPIIVDGATDTEKFALEAERLIVKEKVKAIFGCWTSRCRKSVKKVVEKYQSLLFYPLQYEGLENSPNIIYLGAAPNQQIIPAISWFVNQGKKRFYIIGSDYIFPRIASIIIRDMLGLYGVQLAGESLIPFDGKHITDEFQMKQIILDAYNAKADIIINLINGQDNLIFFRELKKSGISTEAMPVVSMSVSESEIHAFSLDVRQGDYAVWNYFQSLQTPENQKFVNNLHRFTGSNVPVGDPMEAAYLAVKLFAQACANSPDDNIINIKNLFLHQNILAPEGIVSVDKKTMHLWKTVYIGKLRQDGQFDIVWSSVDPVKPEPYPIYRPMMEWKALLNQYEN